MGVELAKRIVLLGPDCSGKSTLAGMLAQHYDIQLENNVRVKDDLDAVDKVLDFVREVIRDTDMPFILDQWQYPVDIVYNKTLLDCPSPIEYIEPLIKPYLKHTLFIHVDAADATLRMRYRVRGDELWNEEQIVLVAQAYREYLKAESGLCVYSIDTTFLTPEGVYDAAVQLIDEFFGERGKLN